LIERDAAADDIWIGIQSLAPEALADEHDIGLLLLFRGEESPEQRSDSQYREEVRGDLTSVDLHRIAQSGEVKSRAGVGGDSREDILRVAQIPVSRYGVGKLLKVSILRFAVNPHQPVRLRERKAAEKEIVDEREDCRVGADAERQRADRKQRETR